MKTRGTGLVFQPTYKNRRTGEVTTSSTWWIQYNVRGKRIRENSGSHNRAEAVHLLKVKLGDAAAGKPVGNNIERTTLADLMAMLEADYRANNRRLRVIKAPLAHLKAYFGEDCRAIEITTDRITAYTVDRQSAGAANSTINRSLAALKRAFTLAGRAGRVGTRPDIAMLDENNARSGFLNHPEFERLREALPDDLRYPVAFLYFSGWRVGEMRSLQWRDVDPTGSVVRLRAENSEQEGASAAASRRAARHHRARAYPAHPGVPERLPSRRQRRWTLPQELGDGMPGRGLGLDSSPRSASHRSPQPRPRWRSRKDLDGHQRASHTLELRSR